MAHARKGISLGELWEDAKTLKRVLFGSDEAALGVAILDGSGNQVTSFGGTGGTSATDDAAFTPGSGTGTPIMGMADEAAPDSVDEGDVGVVRMTLPRALHVNLRDAAGAEVSVGGGTQYDEDTAHVSGDKATMAGVVQQTADSALSGDGDRSLLQVDSSGFLKVNVKTGGAGGTQYTEDAAAAADPVGTALNLVRADSPAAVTTTDGDNIAARGTNKGEQYVKHIDSVPVTDNGGSLTVDGSVSLAAAVPAGTNNIGDVDVLTVPAPLSTTGGGTEATALRVTVANDSTGVVSVDDNGGSLTVDGTVGVSGTVTVGSHAVTNAGTFVTQENGGALTALQLIDDTIIADDAAFTVGTTKVSGAGFLADESSTDSVDEGDMGAARMTLDRKLIVTVEPHTAGGWDTANMTSGDTFTALTNSAQAVKASAGKLGGWYIYNPNATAIYVIIYNVASGSVTVGTTTPKLVLCIPATSAANLEMVNGITFDTAIAVAATTTGGGNTAPGTALEANFFYK